MADLEIYKVEGIGERTSILWDNHSTLAECPAIENVSLCLQ